MKPDGAMRSGVMIVAEALGDAEAEQLKALVGPSGFLMGRAFSRRGWDRDEFRYANVLFCKPTDNVIRHPRGWLLPWAEDAIHHCAPNLDGEINQWQPKVIVALGQTAFTRLTGLTLPLMAARGYAFREVQDRCWVVPTLHPAFLLRGQQALTQVFLWDVAKARQMAQEAAYTFETPTCLTSPNVPEWQVYVADFLQDPSRVLAADIETPYKRKHKDDEDEADLVEEDDPTYQIDCISFAYEEHRGVTVPWTMPYLVGIQQMLEAAQTLIFWNRPYDRPRIMRALAISLPLTRTFDAMDAWHVAFNNLPRKLGFATSCLPAGYRLQAWKHLSSTQPEYYSVMDSIALWRNWRDCVAILERTGQWPVFDLYCRQLDPVLEQMQLAGMPLDSRRREALRVEFTGQLAQIQQEMNEIVPEAVRSPKVWKSEKGAVQGRETLLARLEREGDTLADIVRQAELYPVAGTQQAMTCTVCGSWPASKSTHTGRKTRRIDGDSGTTLPATGLGSDRPSDS